MRRFALSLAAAIALLPALPAASQTAPRAAAPAQPPRCEPREANLGGVGRALIVAFTGPVLGAPVCATVASLVFDAFTARVGDAPAPDALVVATLSGGGTVSVPLEGAIIPDAGPYVVAPGGTIPSFGGDIAEVPRVVLAYAGGRVLLIATSPVALVDLARVLRSQPAVFGTDAVERAVLLASGDAATMTIHTANGDFGTPSPAARVLSLLKR